MKTIIAGSRDVTDPQVLKDAITKCPFEVTEVVSGTARGADRLGEAYANNNNLPLTRMPADWDKYGRSAGYRRNEEMAEVGEALIALWQDQSRGTKHMIEIATRKGLNVYVHKVTT